MLCFLYVGRMSSQQLFTRVLPSLGYSYCRVFSVRNQHILCTHKHMTANVRLSRTLVT